MSKSKKKMMTAIIIISVILIIAAGYTFSKFFKSVPGNATAQIAAWSFKANAGSDTQNLSSITLTPTNGTKIAPGTNGEFQIKVDATGSDVDVDYVVNISQEKLPANMRFNLQGETKNEYTSMASLAAAKLHGKLDSTNGMQKVYIIEWDWPYETSVGNTVLDSKDMEALELSSLGFGIEVVGEQAK